MIVVALMTQAASPATCATSRCPRRSCASLAGAGWVGRDPRGRRALRGAPAGRRGRVLALARSVRRRRPRLAARQREGDIRSRPTSTARCPP
jgi:hypothetical protein